MLVGEPGAGIAKLAHLGFIEIVGGDNHGGVAKVTPDGLKALVIRLARR
jgi:hypothetical protein